MNIAAIIFLMTTSATTLWQEDLPSYEELVDQALHDCKYTGNRAVDEKLLWTLIEAEQRHGVPPELRGMLLAQACGESGFNPNARGDYRDGRPQAIGLFQMWRWWESSYDIVRTDPAQAADAHMKHILRVLKKVKKRCRWRTTRKQWVAAWVTAIRAPKPGGRCVEVPKHLKILKRWYRNIKKSRRILREKHAGSGSCGC